MRVKVKTSPFDIEHDEEDEDEEKCEVLLLEEMMLVFALVFLLTCNWEVILLMLQQR